MRAWHKKLLIDTAKAAAPFPRTLRKIMRRVRPYRTDAANDQHLLGDAIRLAALGDLNGCVVLEFGSGWNPLLPLVFRAAGASRVILTDQELLLDPALLRSAIDYVRGHWVRVREGLGLSDDRLDRLQVSASTPLPALLAELDFAYVCPFKPATIDAASVDIIVSRDVLEHVPRPVLESAMQEFKRILRPGGRMLHRIDMSDHWEHSDKSISRANFLRYSDLAWGMTQLNAQNVQNRLHRTDYLAIVEAAGFHDVRADGAPHAATLAALPTLSLAPRFTGLPPEELAIISTTLTARA